MMAGCALIVVYLIIVGGVKGIVILAAGILLIFFWPGILLGLILGGPALLRKLKGPLGMAARVMKDLLKHMLRPPDR